MDVVSEQSNKVYISGRTVTLGGGTTKRRGGLTVAGSVRKGVEGRHRSWSAIPDGRYDAVLDCLRDNKRPDPKHPHYKQIHRLLLLGKGKLAAVHRFDAALGTEEWRIVDKKSERFVPRVSEIDTVPILFPLSTTPFASFHFILFCRFYRFFMKKTIIQVLAR